MKKALSITTFIALICSLSTAQANHVFEDYARVIKVTPQYEEVNRPREVCETEYIPERDYRQGSLAGPLIGGIAGGVLGAQVGKGSGRVAASAAGAAIGAIVGDRMSRRDRATHYQREVRHCETLDQWETRLSGYRVVYRYHGHTRTTMLPYDPGRKLRLRVAIEPLDAERETDDAWNQ
ncbi:MAG TPA: glycine zipper 2TM domain-containing protein [Burkholderiales bacterium]|nr:glycine zipper 2TM domain-containing protein [Burkholderiales bacterium]